MSNPLRTLKRLTQMTPDEFRVRAAQEVLKRWDAFYFRRQGGDPGDKAGACGEFFFAPGELSSITALISQRMPETVAQTVHQGKRICRHELDLLGYEGLGYGSEIDWHLDAVSGTRAPLKPWFKIHYLNFSEVGDAKVTWELNRHQHLVTLAKAYCFTGDESFVTELIAQWYSWREQNPYPMGVNWASSLEVAFRAIAWLWMLRLLEKCPALRPAFQSDVQRELVLSGRHIERYLSTYFSPNTHLLGEGLGLFYLGLLCDTRYSPRWKQIGWTIVLAEAERQVLPDGMHFEQSTYYHVYALDMFLHARILARVNGIKVPERFDRVLEGMLQALYSIGCAGPVPRFGDDDGGRLFDPHRNQVEHLIDPLSTGAILFNRPDWRAAKPDLVEETIWLLGPDQACAFEGVPAPKPLPKSIALASSGIHVMTLAGKPSARLAIDAGPHGAYGGGHGHADALSIQLAIEGQDVLVDPGTFVYASKGPERQLFRGTAFHNTLQVDAADQADPDGPFPWRRLPQVRVENCVLGSSFDYLVASHNGYECLTNPITHWRRVFGDRSQFWFILDALEGRGSHSAQSFWHLAPGLQWELRADSARTTCQGGQLALLFPAQGWVPRVTESWYSPVYGSRIKTELLTFHYAGELPKRLATLLVPVAASDGARSFGSIRQDFENDQLLACRFDRSPESHFFFSSSHAPWTWRGLLSDAEFLYYSTSECGRKKLFLSGGSYVQVGEERVVSCSRALARLEWSSQGSNSFSCSDPGAVMSTSWEPLSRLEHWAEEVVR